MIPKGIEDKYEVIRVLHESAATAVLLVNYKKIGALRILKAIHKANPNAYSILSEANLLQGFKSSQIPTIYDVEDTEEMFYLIEEYIEGISLREYLQKNTITKEKLLDIAIELCEIIQHLHTAGNEAVLYRDMKPEHVILQADKIRLIDFGISIKKSMASKAMPMGTKEWAAPEQLMGQGLDERCDVYGLGKVIEYMQIYSNAKNDFKIKRIVDSATNPQLDGRLKSVEELINRLKDIKKEKVKDKIGTKRLEKRIAVVGAVPSIGTTRIAISLCRFFNKNKIECYYRDNEKDTVLNLWNNLKNTKLQKGVLYHESFMGIFNYGEAVEHYDTPKGLYILDCGTNKALPLETDIVLYVTGGAPWQQLKEDPSWIKDDNVFVIGNFTDRITCLKLAKGLGKRVYKYPLTGGIDVSKDEERIFYAIFKKNNDFIIGQ